MITEETNYLDEEVGVPLFNLTELIKSKQILELQAKMEQGAKTLVIVYDNDKGENVSLSFDKLVDMKHVETLTTTVLYLEYLWEKGGIYNYRITYTNGYVGTLKIMLK